MCTVLPALAAFSFKVAASKVSPKQAPLLPTTCAVTFTGSAMGTAGSGSAALYHLDSAFLESEALAMRGWHLIHECGKNHSQPSRARVGTQSGTGKLSQ